MADTDFLNNSPKSLWNHKIPNLPDSFYYIPNFLSDVECSALLQKACFLSLIRASVRHSANLHRFLQTDGHSCHIGDCRLGHPHSPLKTPWFQHRFPSGWPIHRQYLTVSRSMEYSKAPEAVSRIMCLSMNITRAKGLCHMKMGQLMNQSLRPLV